MSKNDPGIEKGQRILTLIEERFSRAFTTAPSQRHSNLSTNVS